MGYFYPVDNFSDSDNPELDEKPYDEDSISAISGALGEKFHTMESFSALVELRRAKTHPDKIWEYGSYIDTIVQICQENDYEYEKIVNLLSPSIKHKVLLEAKSVNLVKKNVGEGELGI
jgi:hypothetical protein